MERFFSNKIRLLALYALLLFLPIVALAQTTDPLGLQKIEMRLHTSEKVPSILLDAAFTKGGRGDTAPVYIAAKNLRKMGYNGKIQVVLNDVQAHLALRELSLDYRLKSESAEGAVMIEDGIEVLRNFEGYSSPKIPAPEIGIRFALRPLEIKSASQIKGARWNFFLGANNLSQINATLGSENKVVFAGDGKITPQPLADVGFFQNDLGFYHNKLAAEIGELSTETKQHALLRQLAKDRDIYAKIFEADQSQVWMDKFAKRNQALIDYFKTVTFANKANIANVYGIGMPETWADFSSYVKTLPKDRPIVLFSPTVFKAETEKELLKIVNKHLANDRSFTTINLAEGAAIPTDLKAGDVVFVQTGNFPHETYLHMNSVSTMPNVVAGDNALADMISMGKPFVTTNVGWNIPSTRGVSEYLEQVAKKTGFSDETAKELGAMYLKSDHDRFKNLTKLIGTKEWRDLFTTAAMHAEKHDVLTHLLQIHEGQDPKDLVGQHFGSLKTGITEREIQWKKAYQLIEDEQTKNIKNIYKKGVFDSQMDRR